MTGGKTLKNKDSAFRLFHKQSLYTVKESKSKTTDDTYGHDLYKRDNTELQLVDLSSKKRT